MGGVGYCVDELGPSVYGDDQPEERQDPRPDGRLDLEACLAKVSFVELSAGRAGTQVVFLSDLLMPVEAFTRALEYMLAAQLDVIVVHVLSPEELEPAPGGDF